MHLQKVLSPILTHEWLQGLLEPQIIFSIELKQKDLGSPCKPYVGRGEKRLIWGSNSS